MKRGSKQGCWKVILRKSGADRGRNEELLRESGLDWVLFE